MLATLTALALAQPALDAHGFVPAAADGDPRDPLRLTRPGRLRAGEWFASSLLEYAHDPLVSVTYDTDGAARRDPVVGALVATHLSGGVAVLDRVRLDAALPVVLLTSDPEPAGAVVRGPAFGDLRLRALAAIVRPAAEDLGFGLAIAGQVDAPIGAERRAIAHPGWAGGGDVVASYAAGPLTLTGNVGARFQPAFTFANLRGSDQLFLGLSGGWLITPSTGVTVEAQFLPALQASAAPGTQSPAEVTASFRHRAASGVHAVGGASVGVGPGVGAAAFRLFAGVGFGRIDSDRPPDADLDGVPDPRDACPEAAEIVNQVDDLDGCPDARTAWHLGVTLDGAPVGGAELTLVAEGDAPNAQVTSTWISDSGFTSFEAPPGQRFTASARLGPCLVGEIRGEVGRAPERFAVPLQPVRGSMLRFEVVDPAGRAIDAQVRLTHASPGCAPADAVDLAGGVGSVAVGPGEIRADVAAPGFAPWTSPIVASEADEALVRVTLRPAAP